MALKLPSLMESETANCQSNAIESSAVDKSNKTMSIPNFSECDHHSQTEVAKLDRKTSRWVYEYCICQ